MKKLLAFILAAVMTASLCACGSSKGGAEVPHQRKEVRQQERQ